MSETDAERLGGIYATADGLTIEDGHVTPDRVYLCHEDWLFMLGLARRAIKYREGLEVLRSDAVWPKDYYAPYLMVDDKNLTLVEFIDGLLKEDE